MDFAGGIYKLDLHTGSSASSYFLVFCSCFFSFFPYSNGNWIIMIIICTWGYFQANSIGNTGNFVRQQPKLMGSSAKNSSGVSWCRRRVRFNEVPEKVPKVPETVWEALVQSQVRFNRVPEKVPEKWRRFWRRSGRLWCRASSGSTGFRRRFRRSGEGSGEGLGGFGAEPVQVQQGSGSTRFPRRFR